jgi:hypothetical protein
MRQTSILRLRANGDEADPDPDPDLGLDLDLYRAKASMECLIHHLTDGFLLVKAFLLLGRAPGITLVHTHQDPTALPVHLVRV